MRVDKADKEWRAFHVWTSHMKKGSKTYSILWDLFCSRGRPVSLALLAHVHCTTKGSVSRLITQMARREQIVVRRSGGDKMRAYTLIEMGGMTWR
ncbi:winged helix-turn-helix DNA-binding domain protein [Vibrio phage 1.015.O._10N.222.51.E5]|nr:winged helix-turn-helix DNA-binding domain protein [Vibrio phage 1.015.O._10N.222.51.E5]AUR83406.1 winged helix-turn-helix DNA-binding domain protein [Vibrio phage 1.034.O._10N.261.46.B7]AUR83474.1 winged helix-turn-helix DNA-binding domain protein [Vibrio phage 1.034.X._10N.261.46.B7]AUR90212.1 winged helix-turn-helix DNA-binding domain protein [Vibrio phage 1.139.A._10N.261.48.C6]AUR90279.1 winged helix-turn-helix DNA-binding domain protein [Vibrio phage 1.139.B._10N.261.48.C6]AUR95600.1 